MTHGNVVTHDIDAVRDAIDALNDVGIDVTDIERIDPDPDGDGYDVAFTLNCRAASRSTDINDFAVEDPDP